MCGDYGVIAGVDGFGGAFDQATAKKNPTPLEEHFATLRADTEKRIGYIQMAADVCKELGYDLSDVPGYKLIRLLTEAVDTASTHNGYAGGDSYSPFDKDLAFPTKSTLGRILFRTCEEKRIPKIVVPDQSELNLKLA